MIVLDPVALTEQVTFLATSQAHQLMIFLGYSQQGGCSNSHWQLMLSQTDEGVPSIAAPP